MAAVNPGNAGSTRIGPVWSARQLLIFVFRGAGECGDDGRQKDHSKKRQANQKIVHL